MTLLRYPRILWYVRRMMRNHKLFQPSAVADILNLVKKIEAEFDVDGFSLRSELVILKRFCLDRDKITDLRSLFGLYPYIILEIDMFLDKVRNSL